MSIRVLIPDHIQDPFPIICESEVVCGFGRGSAELGIPTANVPVDESLDNLKPGVYFGWCKVTPTNDERKTSIGQSGKSVEFNYGSLLSADELKVLPMVMSIGWNPFYNNQKKAAEVHIIHKFSDNFYGAHIKICILGYIRPELDYTTKGTYGANFEKKILLTILRGSH